MLFRDSHIEKPPWILYCEFFHSSSVGHGGAYRHEFWTLLSFFYHPVSKYIRVGSPSSLLDLSRLRQKTPHSVEGRWIVLCGKIPLSFLRHHMHQHRAVFDPCRRPECFQHILYIMPVNGPHINDSHLLKQHPRHQKMFQGILGILYGLRHRNPHIGNPVETLFNIYLQVIIFLIGTHFTEIV